MDSIASTSDGRQGFIGLGSNEVGNQSYHIGSKAISVPPGLPWRIRTCPGVGVGVAIVCNCCS